MTTGIEHQFAPEKKVILGNRTGASGHGQRGGLTTKKPELDSGLSATFYTENHTKASLDAAPQIYACQPHTVRLLRFGIVNVMNIAERLSPACHQFW
jgi:hypothetical protein